MFIAQYMRIQYVAKISYVVTLKIVLRNALHSTVFAYQAQQIQSNAVHRRTVHPNEPQNFNTCSTLKARFWLTTVDTLHTRT